MLPVLETGMTTGVELMNHHEAVPDAKVHPVNEVPDVPV